MVTSERTSTRRRTTQYNKKPRFLLPAQDLYGSLPAAKRKYRKEKHWAPIVDDYLQERYNPRPRAFVRRRETTAEKTRRKGAARDKHFAYSDLINKRKGVYHRKKLIKDANVPYLLAAIQEEDDARAENEAYIASTWAKWNAASKPRREKRSIGPANWDPIQEYYDSVESGKPMAQRWKYKKEAAYQKRRMKSIERWQRTTRERQTNSRKQWTPGTNPYKKRKRTINDPDIAPLFADWKRYEDNEAVDRRLRLQATESAMLRDEARAAVTAGARAERQASTNYIESQSRRQDDEDYLALLNSLNR